MRFFNLLIICLSCFLLVACLVPQTTSDICTHASPIAYPRFPVQYLSPPKPAQQPKGFQYYATVYQQWIILGVYILTTVLMAFYAKKQDKRKIQNVKKVADTLLISRKGRPGMLLRLFNLLFKTKRK